MISTDVPAILVDQSSPALSTTLRRVHGRWRLRALHPLLWLCLALACVGANWFAYQYSLIPQSKSFVPDWQGAQWVQTADVKAPVAYFRDSLNLNVLPDGIFITVAANQVFRLYANGIYISSSSLDFVSGSFPHAYVFDLNSTVQRGTNVIGLRVTNVDQQLPAIRVSIGIVRGNTVQYVGSDSTWRATSQTTAVFPFANTSLVAWTSPHFDASAWPAAKIAPPPPISPRLTINPLVYEQPLPWRWMSTGGAHDAYFVRQIQIPPGFTGGWMRLAANGLASIFINGQMYMVWNGQPNTPHTSAADYLSSDRTSAHYRRGLALGIYDISPYIHTGNNVITVHVQMAGYNSAHVGLADLNASMALDMLLTNSQGQSQWIGSDDGWRGSAQPVDNWTQDPSVTRLWPPVMLVGRPGVVNTFYLADNTTPRSIQITPPLLIVDVVMLTTGAVLTLWLLLSLLFRWLYTCSYICAFETMGLAFIPPCVVEVCLLALSRETLIPQPFPYTSLWGGILLLLTGVSALALFLNAHYAQRTSSLKRHSQTYSLKRLDTLRSLFCAPVRASGPLARYQRFLYALWRWLSMHWPLLLILLIAFPMISYNLQYEPYWQDELTSYYAAKGIMQHGLPMLASGFIYTKAELYSYVLALVMVMLGDAHGAPRLLSVVEYLASLPLFYMVICRFFGRRVAVLATAMLAFSPYALTWGRQVRMYEQAQFLTLLVVYLFYRAARSPQRPWLAYSAFLCLALDYLSHEEIFIALPALALCILLASKTSKHGLLEVFYHKHWWIAGVLCGGVIGAQLLAVNLTHPPVLGTDESQRPFIQFTLNNVTYYFTYLFQPAPKDPWITVNSFLAVTGCLLARRSKQQCIRYMALFLVVAFLTLILVFTMASDRYMYPLLPYYYAIGAYALEFFLQRLWRFAQIRISTGIAKNSIRADASPALPFSIRLVAICIVALIYGCVVLMPALPLSNYNLFVSRALELPYHRHRLDLDTAGEFMQRNWHSGDIVIAVAPNISVYYYVGHLDYYFSINRALYLFERNGHLVDTPTGVGPLLNQADFQSVLSTHARVWIISDNGHYQGEVNKYFTFPPDCHLVYEGYGSAIYFRGD